MIIQLAAAVWLWGAVAQAAPSREVQLQALYATSGSDPTALVDGNPATGWVTTGDTDLRLGKAKPAKDIGKKDVEGVFVVGSDNKVTFRPVKVGIAGEKDFEILSGLKEGEKIVAGTYQAIRELKDGALVRAPKPDTKKPTSGTKS